ncbi:hypothetical protein WH390_12110 [Candidatus Arsenophonus nilaparvatae]|uniref:hypothetical protein n=1 Tax=Candidatus Arsenophonus nilaparvatae TaxID=1247023 RepID=UPI000509B23F|nr:hypothetical protein [Candidatus Arsenophonus nilaparvatae]
MDTDKFKVRNHKLKGEMKNKIKEKIKFGPSVTVNDNGAVVTVRAINNINIVVADGGKSQIGNITSGKENHITATAKQHGNAEIGDIIACEKNTIRQTAKESGRSIIKNVTAGKENDITVTAVQYGSVGIGDVTAGHNINITGALSCETPAVEKPCVYPEQVLTEDSPTEESPTVKTPSVEEPCVCPEKTKENLTTQSQIDLAPRLGVQTRKSATDNNLININYNQINIINIDSYSSFSIEGNIFDINMREERLGQIMSEFKNKESTAYNICTPVPISNQCSSIYVPQVV